MVGLVEHVAGGAAAVVADAVEVEVLGGAGVALRRTRRSRRRCGWG